MKSLSNKKCLRQSLLLLGFFLLFVFIIVLFALMHNALLTGVIIGLVFGTVFCLLPASYYFIRAMRSAKKSHQCEKQIGKVYNWNSWARKFGSVSILINDREYSTPAYFTGGEARALVGKNISFCIIGESLYIHDVLD